MSGYLVWSDKCQFRKTQINRTFSKISFCSGFYSIKTIRKVNIINIKFENIIFGIFFLKLSCNEYFFYLSFKRNLI